MSAISMLLESITSEMNPRKTHLYIETLLLKVLEAEANRQNKEFISNNNLISNDFFKSNYPFDAYAPDGLFEIEGPTGFEIKTYTKFESLLFLSNKQLKNNKHRFDLIDNTTLKNIVYLVTLDLNEKELNKINDRFSNFNKNIVIWDIKRISQIIESNKDIYNKISKNLSEFALDSNINRNLNQNKDYWKNKQKEYISDLQNKFADDDLTLVLGAGTSLKAGIPSWDKLVTELLVSLIEVKLKEKSIIISDKERSNIIDKLKAENANSPLLQTRYIRTGLKDNFTETLQSVLYKECKNASKILEAITKLCQPLRNRNGIKAIINFNFDDLIEYNLTKAEIKHKSIYRESDIQSNEALSIYHVHGYLPRSSSNTKDIEDSLLVFSEEGYHSVMLDPYHWSNLIQLNYLRENTCLFIGLSMTDPNLRRLLDIAMRKRTGDECQHYAILKKETLIVDSESNNSSISNFSSVNNGIQEEVLKELGVNIIWVNDHDDIPELIKSIRN